MFQRSHIFLHGSLLALLVWAPDRIVLQNGAVLEGEILSESGDVIEIRIGEGQIVGVSRSSAKEIFRDPNRPKSLPAPKSSADSPNASKLTLGEQRFLVEDREGKTRAVLRSLTRRDEPSETNPAGGFVLEEHWEFPESGQMLRVSWIESLAEDLSPRDLLYREDGCGAGKIVLAKRSGERLEVEISGGPEKRKISLPWNPGSLFPLGPRAELREKALRSSDEHEISVFDPRLLVFERRLVTLGARRSVEWQGEEKNLFFYRCEGKASGAWEDWIDPRLGVLRRECNGPDLVARLAKPEEIEAFLKGEALPTLEKTLVDPLGRFRIRLTDSSWKRDAAADSETLLLQGKNGDRAVLFFFDGAAPSDSAETRVSAVERKLQASLEKYRRDEKLSNRTFQGRNAVEFGFTFTESDESRRGLALLIAERESTLAVLFSFSVEQTAAIPAEWERLLSRIDLP